MKKLSIAIRHHILLENIAGLLDSASRGSSYWAENELGYESETDKVLKNGEYSIIRDIEEESSNNEYQLNLKMVKKGLTVMAKKYPKHFADFINEDYDQTTGDVFLQCCLFGDVIYG